MAGWLVTLALATVLAGALAAAGLVRAFVVVALGLTTTAFGTLLPILRDNDLLGGRFGRYLLAAGAVGELFPIFAIALFLGANNKFVALGSLAAVGVLAVVLLLLLLAVAEDFGLDVVLAAVLRGLGHDPGRPLDRRGPGPAGRLLRAAAGGPGGAGPVPVPP
jgi:Kef-type K+ transport system membrane component KefB